MADILIFRGKPYKKYFITGSNMKQLQMRYLKIAYIKKQHVSADESASLHKASHQLQESNRELQGWHVFINSPLSRVGRLAPIGFEC